MSEAFIGAIAQHCPNAQLVLDRFHVVKALNDAVDEVRKEQWRQAATEDRKALKGLRWSFDAPIRAGDTVRVRASVRETRSSRRFADRGSIGLPSACSGDM